MSRSIFDPTGPNTERSGNRNLGPDADNRSRMPDSAVDGVVGDSDEQADDIIDMIPEPKGAESPEPSGKAELKQD